MNKKAVTKKSTKNLTDYSIDQLVSIITKKVMIEIKKEQNKSPLFTYTITRKGVMENFLRLNEAV